MSKYTGIDPPYFDMEYAERKYNYIKFEPVHEANTYLHTDPRVELKPDYTLKRIELYRYTSKEGWKLLSKNARMTDLKDTDVAFGKSYKYRLQAIATAKIGGKTKVVKSAYVYKTLKAANDRGYFVFSFVDTIPQADTMPAIGTELVMHQYNDDTVFHFGKGSENVSVYIDGVPANNLYITDYKLDDGEWTKAESDVKVGHSQKIRLRMIPADGAESIELPENCFLVANVSYGKEVWEGKCVMYVNGSGRISPYVFQEQEYE